MRAFYGSKISPHLTRTPEGYLICLGVPICRTGSQEYLPQEIGVESDKSIINVLRSPQEVFKPAAIASFEGKPVTDDHPPVGLDSSNYASYTKGVVQNVRRGSGEDADKLVCDIVIYDATLISKVEAGKREISCGYDCQYVENGDGSYHQANIIGNHVAIVDSGRAGRDVAIRDAKPEGGKKMAKRGILHRMFAAFVKDADPDEIREAAKAVEDAEKEPAAEPEKKDNQDVHDVLDAVDDLSKTIEGLKGGNVSCDQDPVDEQDPDDEEDDTATESMDALEDELSGGDEDEEQPDAQDSDPDDEDSVVVPPEKIKDVDPEEGDEPPLKKPQPAQDKAIALRIIRSLKPIVASMPDPQRRRCADAMTRAVRKALRTRATQPLPGGYGALTHRRVSDAAYNKQGDPRAFGEACARMNPHLNRGGK